MSIWTYKSNDKHVTDDLVHKKKCVYCGCEMKQVQFIKYKNNTSRTDYLITSNDRTVHSCVNCGWWTVSYQFFQQGEYCGDLPIIRNSGAAASLKELAVPNIDLPTKDIVKYYKRGKNYLNTNASCLEETVVAAFKNYGYDAQATAYQNDGGIDVILRRTNNEIIGVQVIKDFDDVKCSQISEFAGVLKVNNYTKGIYITTKQSESNSKKRIKQINDKGIPIEIMEIDKLFDALDIRAIDSYVNDEEMTDYLLRIPLIPLYYFDDSGTHWTRREDGLYDFYSDYQGKNIVSEMGEYPRR